MTDDPDEFDINELAAALAARVLRPPDAIPPLGLTRKSILILNAAALQWVTAEHSQPMLESPDGEPLGVPPQIVGTTMMSRAMIPRHALEDAGLTEADVPALRVVDGPRRPR